ncbi:MAG: hypothetical protein Q9160_004165 [Pyrenula sp. 1 TL-2023]
MTAPSSQVLKFLRQACFSTRHPPITFAAHQSRPCILNTSSLKIKPTLGRSLITTSFLQNSSGTNSPKTTDRGPPSDEDTQTDFNKMDIFSSTAQPATTIDACLPTGFHLNNGAKIDNGDGVLLIGGQAFAWRPWLATTSRSRNEMVNSRGAWQVTAQEAWGILDAVFPKPDLLVLGVGRYVLPVGKETKERLNGMGIRVDVQDTRNAAAEFNLLATERGVNSVVAALLPIGWDGAKR